MTRRNEDDEQTHLANRFQVADVMQTSMDGCWIVDAAGRLVEVNDAYCKIVGFAREELVGQTISFVEALETPEVTSAHVRKILEIGRDRFETQHRKKDGGVLDIEVSTIHLGKDGDRADVFLVFLRDITARKRSEEALRAASEGRLSVALASVDMAVFQQDRDLVYTWMARPQCGYTTGEVIGKTDLELLPPDDARRIVDVKRRVLDTGEPMREIVPVKIGEDTYYYDLVVEPLRDPNGVIVGVAGASLDLTERVRAQRALEASETRYRLLFEKSTEAVFLIDRRTGKYVSANPATEELTGRSLRDLVQRTLFEIAPEYAGEHWLRLVATRAPLDLGEVTHLRPDGTKRVAALSVVPLGDDCLIGFAHDLTDRKVGEDKLQTLSSAVERSPASIVITDAAGNIEYVNPKFVEVTGYSAEEVLGRNPRILQSGRTPPEEHRRLWETITRGGEWRGEFENRRKDGRIIWELASIASIADAAGVIKHFVAVKEDITDRKRADEERRTLEEQLNHAQRMEAVGRLAAGIAHDFNNVLSVILSYSEMIVGDLTPQEPLRADVEEIRTAGLRAADLTRQLLAFSRQQVLQAKVLDLNQSIAGIEKMLRRLLGADIELTTLPASGLWNVKVDSGQIEQIVMNLAVNARDAMPKGGKLTIETTNVVLDDHYARAHVDVSAGSYVMLAMSDSGTGMDKETQGRIFEPFFTTKEQGKGTGLGLATVFGIVKQSGGHIWVYSEPGKGATFKIYFPRVSAGREVRISQPAAPKRGGGETILLVEDDDQVRAVAQGILRRNGYVVLEAPNGGEALLICEQHGAKIHLLLTDVILPRMSGRQLAERLVPQRPEMKVLFMSGYTDDAILQHGVLDSGVAFLQKPLTPTSLTSKVREVLRGGSGT